MSELSDRIIGLIKAGGSPLEGMAPESISENGITYNIEKSFALSDSVHPFSNYVQRSMTVTGEILRTQHLYIEDLLLEEQYEAEAMNFLRDAGAKVLHYAVGDYACGYAIGLENEFEVKHARRSGNWDSFFETGHGKTIRYSSISILDDQDTVQTLEAQFKGTIAWMMHECGITHGAMSTTKVWDLIVAAGVSVRMAIFLAGLQIGRQDATTADLEGILRATEEKADE